MTEVKRKRWEKKSDKKATKYIIKRTLRTMAKSSL